MLGCAAKRRLRMVDFPEPEGPDITIGRCVRVAVVRIICEPASVLDYWKMEAGKGAVKGRYLPVKAITTKYGN